MGETITVDGMNRGTRYDMELKSNTYWREIWLLRVDPLGRPAGRTSEG